MLNFPQKFSFNIIFMLEITIIMDNLANAILNFSINILINDHLELNNNQSM